MEEPRDLLFHEWLMFNQVMMDEHEVCRRLLEVVLERPIERIASVETEKVVEPALGAKGVRFDAYAKSAGAVYDVEIQAYEIRELGRRMRYYQSVMDVSELRKGRSYRSLAESFVIFICVEDQMGAGLPVYHFDMTCAENGSISLNHGFHWVVINASAWDNLKDGPLRSLLQYVATGEEDGDSLVTDIAAAVRQANKSAVWRQKGLDMLSYIEDTRIQAELIAEEGYRNGLEKGYAEGREKGVEQGLAEGIEQGIEQGENRLGALIAKLLEADRIDDVAAASSDHARRDELFAEFGL